jgi:hypothetical protein
MIDTYLETLEGRLRGPARRSILTGGKHWDDFTCWLAGNGGQVIHEQRGLEIWQDAIGFCHMKFNRTVGVCLTPRLIEGIFGTSPDVSVFAGKVAGLSAALNTAISGGDMPADNWAFIDALRARYAADLPQWKMWARAQVKAGSLRPVVLKGTVE